MDVAEALKVLGLTPPVSPNVLKTTYRRRAREEHPDVSKHPEAGERFRRVQASYELLSATGSVLEYTEKESRELTTDDGTKLSELGKGLGPTTNGRPCDDCDGKGYRSWLNSHTVRCDSCPARGACYTCKGTGVFKRPGKLAERCRKCNGSGRYATPCKKCHGRGWVTDLTAKRNYAKCGTCKGTGELMVFNPVLPKGLLGGFK